MRECIIICQLFVILSKIIAVFYKVQCKYVHHHIYYENENKGLNIEVNNVHECAQA